MVSVGQGIILALASLFAMITHFLSVKLFFFISYQSVKAYGKYT